MNIEQKIIATFIFFLGILNYSTAQDISINTDRPDQSDGVSTVPFQKIQLEEGITLSEHVFTNNLAVRYGLTHSTELRILLDFGAENSRYGLQPVTLSLKQKLINQKRFIPAISFVGYVSSGQLSSKDYRSSQWPFQLKLAFENEISEKWALSYNVGTSNQFKNLDLTFNLGFSPSDKISTFLEYFSTLNDLSFSHNLDAGVLYLFTPLLQADIALGSSIFTNNNQLFTTIGVSYLFY